MMHKFLQILKLFLALKTFEYIQDPLIWLLVQTPLIYFFLEIFFPSCQQHKMQAHLEKDEVGRS